MPVVDPFADLHAEASAPVAQEDPFADLADESRGQSRARFQGAGGAQFARDPTLADRAASLAQVPAEAIRSAMGTTAKAGIGLGHAVGAVSDETLADENAREAARHQLRAERLGSVPGATTAADLAGTASTFLVPGGAILGPTAIGGDAYADAIGGGATKGEAIGSGALQGGVAAALPVIGRTVAPLVRPLGESLAGRVGQGAAQGAVGGVVQGGAAVAGTSLYDPEAAKAQISEIPLQVLLFGGIGGVHAGLARPSAAPTPAAPFADLHAEEGRVDPSAVTQEMPALTEEQVTPPTWQPHGPINTEPIKSPAAAINAEESTQDIGVENAKIDQAIGRLEAKRRILATGKPVVGPDETQIMPAIQDEVATVPGESARTYPTISPQDEIKTQANARPFPRPDVPPDHPTFSTQDLTTGERAQIGGAAEMARMENERARSAAIHEVAKRDAIAQADVARKQWYADNKPAMEEWATKYLNGEARHEDAPAPGKVSEVKPPSNDTQMPPIEAPRLRPDETGRAVESAPAGAMPKAAPIKAGDRATVSLKGHPFEARIDEVRPDGRLRLTSADGRTFPGVDPSKVTRIEGNAPAPASRTPAPAAMPRSVTSPQPKPTAPGARPVESAPARLSGEDFRKQLDALPINKRTPGLTDSIMAITEARAKSAGVSLDDYVGRRIARVQESSSGPSLNQKDLLQGETLKQSPGAPDIKRGAVQFLSDGRAIIHAFEHADASTALHELGHVFRRDLAGPDLATAEAWAGARNGKWGRAAEEKFARGFERYVREGVAPTPELRPVFQKFYDWLKGVYQAIKGGPIDVKVSPAMKRLFDRLLTPEGVKGLPEMAADSFGESAAAIKAAEPAPSADVRADRMAKLKAARGESPNVEPKADAPKPASQPAPKAEAKPEAPPEAGKGLANYGTTEAVRENAKQLDEQRAADGKPDYKPEAEAHDEATRRLDADYAREKAMVFTKARSGVMLDRVETVMAQRILDREGRQALASNDPKAMADLAALHNAFRDVRGDQARALAIGRDPQETRKQRMLRHAIDSIYTPPASILRGLKKARNDMREAKTIEKRDAAKAREAELLKAAANQMKKVREHMRKAGVDLLYEGENPEVIANIVNEASKANGTWGGAFREFWINGVLSGPRSLTTNATAAQAVWRLTADRFAEAMVNHMGPKRLDSATVGEFKYMLRGLLPGVTRGWQNAIKSFRAERPIFGDEIQGSTQVEGNGPQISGAKGRVIRIPSRILLAADQFNKTWSAHVEVGAQAYRLAKQAGLEGEALTERIQSLVDDLESPAWDKAKEEATDLAFQNEGGKVMRSVMSLRNAQIPGTDLRPLFYVMPFIKTPTNIVKAGIKASPLGALNMAMKFAGEHIRTDGYRYERDQMVRDAAQQLVGLAMSTAVAGLALHRDENGLPYITGAEGSYDSGKADLQNRTMKPYTIRIPGTGVQFDYSRVEPFATWFGLVADMAHTAERSGRGQSTHDTITQAWEAVKNQAINKTSLQGVSDFLKAFDHGQQGQGWLANWSRNFTTSWIPNVVRAPQRDAMNTQQEARVWGDGSEYWWNWGKRIAQTAAPWTEKPKIGVWGQPVTKVEDAPATDWLYRLSRVGSPVAAQPDESVANLDRLLVNWNNDPKNKAYYPLPVAAKYQTGGDTHFMTDAQLERYGKKAGSLAVEWLAKCELHPDAPTTQDIKTITNILRRARRVARREVLSGDHDSPDDE